MCCVYVILVISFCVNGSESQSARRIPRDWPVIAPTGLRMSISPLVISPENYLADFCRECFLIFWKWKISSDARPRSHWFLIIPQPGNPFITEFISIYLSAIDEIGYRFPEGSGRRQAGVAGPREGPSRKFAQEQTQTCSRAIGHAHELKTEINEIFMDKRNC